MEHKPKKGLIIEKFEACFKLTVEDIYRIA
jgi:hypothetical protein